MRITAAKILITINVIVFLFILFDTTAIYNSEPYGSQYCCQRDIYEDSCDFCEYGTCCEYTYIDYNFALIPYGVFEKPWVLITSMFLHAGFFHIFLNMLALIIFGIYLEKVAGWKNFLLIYFIGGVVGSMGYVVFAAYLGEIFIPAVGASGAVYAIVAALMIIRPHDAIFNWEGLEILPTFFVGILWLAIAVSGILIDFIAGEQSGVANSAHLAGGVAGMILGFYFRGFYATNRDVERYHRPPEERYEELARREGARVVRRDTSGRYELIDDIDRKKDEDELEIGEERKISKDSGNELEIL